MVVIESLMNACFIIIKNHNGFIVPRFFFCIHMTVDTPSKTYYSIVKGMPPCKGLVF